MLLHLSGDANLQVNVSVELTGEKFQSELTTTGSELFKNKSHWIEAQVGSWVSHFLAINRLTKAQNDFMKMISIDV